MGIERRLQRLEQRAGARARGLITRIIKAHKIADGAPAYLVQQQDRDVLMSAKELAALQDGLGDDTLLLVFTVVRRGELGEPPEDRV